MPDNCRLKFNITHTSQKKYKLSLWYMNTSMDLFYLFIMDDHFFEASNLSDLSSLEYDSSCEWHHYVHVCFVITFANHTQ